MIRLVVFDLDGTLLRGRTTCEMLAEPLGHGARMRELERFRTREELTLARIEMSHWYPQPRDPWLDEALEAATFAEGAFEACRQLRAAGVELAIASITCSFAVERLAGRLDIRRFIGTEVRGPGDILHCWPEDKAAFLEAIASELGSCRDEIAAVGDSVGDIPMFEAAGLAIHVGPDASGMPEHVVRWPDADLRGVAALVLSCGLLAADDTELA